MVFNIHYIADTAAYAKATGQVENPNRLGEIVSYQEGPDVHTDDDIPTGCKLLAFPDYIHIFDGSLAGPNNPNGSTSGILIYKVDVKNEEIVLKNPPPPAP